MENKTKRETVYNYLSKITIRYRVKGYTPPKNLYKFVYFLERENILDHFYKLIKCYEKEKELFKEMEQLREHQLYKLMNEWSNKNYENLQQK